MKKKIVFPLLLLVLVLFACNEGKESDVISSNKENEIMAADTQKFIAIPETDRYMFESGRCEGVIPQNEEIKRIALSKTCAPDGENGVWFVIYGRIDFEEKKLAYYTSENRKITEPEIVQEFDLSEEDVERYLSSFNSNLLKDEISFGTGWWKVAVECKDGSCYAYEIRQAGAKNNTPENAMIRAFFDKIELSDYNRLICFLFK